MQTNCENKREMSKLKLTAWRVYRREPLNWTPMKCLNERRKIYFFCVKAIRQFRSSVFCCMFSEVLFPKAKPWSKLTFKAFAPTKFPWSYKFFFFFLNTRVEKRENTLFVTFIYFLFFFPSHPRPPPATVALFIICRCPLSSCFHNYFMWHHFLNLFRLR